MASRRLPAARFREGAGVTAREPRHARPAPDLSQRRSLTSQQESNARHHPRPSFNVLERLRVGRRVHAVVRWRRRIKDLWLFTTSPQEIERVKDERIQERANDEPIFKMIIVHL